MRLILNIVLSFLILQTINFVNGLCDQDHLDQCDPILYPTKGKNALIISGEFRSMNYTWHNIYENIIKPNEMDVFISLSYRNHIKCETDTVNMLEKLPFVKYFDIIGDSGVDHDLEHVARIKKEYP